MGPNSELPLKGVRTHNAPHNHPPHNHPTSELPPNPNQPKPKPTTNHNPHNRPVHGRPAHGPASVARARGKREDPMTDELRVRRASDITPRRLRLHLLDPGSRLEVHRPWCRRDRPVRLPEHPVGLTPVTVCRPTLARHAASLPRSPRHARLPRRRPEEAARAVRARGRAGVQPTFRELPRGSRHGWPRGGPRARKPPPSLGFPCEQRTTDSSLALELDRQGLTRINVRPLEPRVPARHVGASVDGRLRARPPGRHRKAYSLSGTPISGRAPGVCMALAVSVRVCVSCSFHASGPAHVSGNCVSCRLCLSS